MSILKIHFFLCFFVLQIPLLLSQDRTTDFVVYRTHSEDYIFYINNLFYSAFDIVDTYFDTSNILLYAEVDIDTILMCDTNMEPEGLQISYANDMTCSAQLPICDVYIKDTSMSVILYQSDGYFFCRLLPDEMKLLTLLYESCPDMQMCVYIDTFDINHSTCNYIYLLYAGDASSKKKIFVSGYSDNIPKQYTMLQEFIMALVRKYSISDIIQPIRQLNNIRGDLKQMESIYSVISEPPTPPADIFLNIQKQASRKKNGRL